MKKFTTIAVIVAICALGYLNWGRIAPMIAASAGGAQAAAASAAPAPIALGEVPVSRYRFVALDPTTSTDVSFRESMKALLVSTVESYMPAKTETPKDGVDAITGLELTVRLVGTDSLAYGQPNYAVSIPGVPALPVRPDMTADGALDPGGSYEIWKKAEEDWSAQYDAAIAATAAASSALQAIDLNRDEFSGITDAVAALTMLAPAGGNVKYLVMSDLDQNRPEQAASFNGAPVSVIQPDPAGDIAKYDGLYTTFTAWVTANGGSEGTHVRPELASSLISTFIKGE